MQKNEGFERQNLCACLGLWRDEEDHRKQLFQKKKVTDWLSGYHGLPRPKILNTCDNFKGTENNPRFLELNRHILGG